MTSTDRTVTALIPTRRRPDHLRRAIESVLAQTWADLRVFVSDNASGDATEAVVRELADRDPRVVYHRHEHDIGAYPNFQFALDAVGTGFYSFLSDDDLLLPDLYRRAVEALEREPDAGFYASQVVLYDVARGTHSVRPSKRWRAGRHEAGRSARLMTELHFVWTGTVFRTSIRDTLGPLEQIPMADILYSGRAAALFPFVADLRPGAVFSETGSNYSRRVPVEVLNRSREVARTWAAGLASLPESEREAMVDVVDGRLGVMAHGMLRDAAEQGEWSRFLEVAAYLEARPDLDPRRRRKIAFGRKGGWRFRALSTWTRLQSGYKRRKSSGFKRRSIEEIVDEYA